MTKIEKARELQAANKFEFRSCWECNPAHEWMRREGGLRVCFECGRWSFQGGYLDDESHRESEWDPKWPQGGTVALKVELGGGEAAE